MTLCSRCSEIIKPVAAIDIDGTLGDWHSHFLAFLEKWLGLQPGYVPADIEYDGSWRFRDWVTEVYAIDLATFRAIKLAYRQGGLKRMMPIYGGADQLVNRVRRKGAEVWLTTTRPHDRFDRIDPDTREWLRRHNIEFDGLLYSEAKIEELAERVSPERVVAVLDDQRSVLEQAEDLNLGTPILRRTTYNAAVPWESDAVPDLDTARELIISQVDNWKELQWT